MLTLNKGKLDSIILGANANWNSRWDLKAKINPLNLKLTYGTSFSLDYGDSGELHTLTLYRYLNDSITSQTARTTGTAYAGWSYSASGHLDLIIGSGLTTPTVEDYKLESQITTLQNISFSIDYKYAGTTVTRVFKNTSESSITVSEVGVLVRIPTTYSDSADCDPILISRSLLPTPITVSAGQTFAIQANL